MVEIRLATVEDAELIAWQRRQMFVDAEVMKAEDQPALASEFLAWVRPRLLSGDYAGWLAEQDGRVVGGAGVWWMEFPPHWMDVAAMRAYLLNFYVAPEVRGQGIAGPLLDGCVAEARRRGVKVVTLHASKFGKPIYERYGFTATSEMMLQLDGGTV